MSTRQGALRRATARTSRWRDQTRRWRRDAGMTTAEYAVGIMAAVTFALVLLAVVRSDAVRGALSALVSKALGLGG